MVNIMLSIIQCPASKHVVVVVTTAVPCDGDTWLQSARVVPEWCQSGGNVGGTTEVRESPATEPSHCLGRLLGPEAAGLSSRKLPMVRPWLHPH